MSDFNPLAHEEPPNPNFRINITLISTEANRVKVELCLRDVGPLLSRVPQDPSRLPHTRGAAGALTDPITAVTSRMGRGGRGGGGALQLAH